MPSAKDDEALIAWMMSGPIPETTILAQRPFAGMAPAARKAAVDAAQTSVVPSGGPTRRVGKTDHS